MIEIILQLRPIVEYKDAEFHAAIRIDAYKDPEYKIAGATYIHRCEFIGSLNEYTTRAEAQHAAENELERIRKPLCAELIEFIKNLPPE